MHVIFYSHQEAKLCVLKCLRSNLWPPAGRSNTIIAVQRNQLWCGEESDQKAEELASARNCLPNAVCVHPACPFANGGDQPAAWAWKYLATPHLLCLLDPCVWLLSYSLWPPSWPLIYKSSSCFFGCFSVEVNKYFLFNSFCLLSCFFILERFQLLSFANFQRSPLGICTLLLFLSFKHFKAKRVNPQ